MNAIEKDQTWQDFVDLVRRGSADVIAHHLGQIRVGNFDPYNGLLQRRILQFVHSHGFGAAYRIIGDVVTENEGR